MEDVHGAEDLRPVIYVTGFGPFSGHAINASQLAVELLPREDIEEKLGVRLITEIVEVEYEYVKKTIPQRWKKYMPKLTVHVGVSNLAETLTLEQLAHNTGYEKEDNCGCVPIGGLCHSENVLTGPLHSRNTPRLIRPSPPHGRQTVTSGSILLHQNCSRVIAALTITAKVPGTLLTGAPRRWCVLFCVHAAPRLPRVTRLLLLVTCMVIIICLFTLSFSIVSHYSLFN